MKTKIRLTIWSLAALLTIGFTACKDEDPFSKLTEDSLEYTTWILEKHENYSKFTKAWEDVVIDPDGYPFYLCQFKEGKCEMMDYPANTPYEIDPVKRRFTLSLTFDIKELSADKFVFETPEENRYTYKRIAPLQPAKLYGKWKFTQWQQFTNKWETHTPNSDYWIQFNSNGSSTDKLGKNGSYTINGNIVNTNRDYKKFFVLELTDNKLVFIFRSPVTNNYTINIHTKIE